MISAYANAQIKGNEQLAKARAGNPEAQYQVGELFVHDGRVEEAMHYLKKSAAQNNPLAAYLLGDIYANREEIAQSQVKSDLEKARAYYLQAANTGYPRAYARLGDLATNADEKRAYYNEAAEAYAPEAFVGIAQLDLNEGHARECAQNYTNAILLSSEEQAQNLEHEILREVLPKLREQNDTAAKELHCLIAGRIRARLGLSPIASNE